MAFIFLTLMNHTRTVLAAACRTLCLWSSVWFRTFLETNKERGAASGDLVTSLDKTMTQNSDLQILRI